MIRLTSKMMIRVRQVKLTVPEGRVNVVEGVLVNRLVLLATPDLVRESMVVVTVADDSSLRQAKD